MKKPLIILTGPTAVGKTELSLSLAKKIRGAVISADSMQVYRHMDIGSAKIRPSEMQGIPHYLIDVLEPWEEFHVVRFQEMALACMQEIYENEQIPILTGGTGFYIQALLYGIDFTEEKRDDAYRARLEQLANEQGPLALHKMLACIDAKAAQQIHANNVKRVIRALEFHHLTGRKISAHNEEERQKTSPYRFCYFVLNDHRERLYQRIEERVDKMLDQGLLAEVEGLKAMGCTRNMGSMQGLGYKELLDYLEGEISFEEAVSRIKRDTRHFAKRQLTWFRREREVLWLNKPDFAYDNEKILRYMEQKMTEAGIGIG